MSHAQRGSDEDPVDRGAVLPVVDLHSHYPMQLELTRRVPTSSHHMVRQLASVARFEAWRWAQRALQDAGTRANVSLAQYREAGVSVAFSVLYSGADEFAAGLSQSPPQPDALRHLLEQLEQVERAVDVHAPVAVVARDHADLGSAREQHKLALVHCVEGGFHLGGTLRSIKRNVDLLRNRGVAYVTLAHLLHRQIATNNAGMPWLPDAAFHRLHAQPARGLSDLGRAAVKALFEAGILIDVSHMSERSLADTVELLDTLDPRRRMPLIASHVACRLGSRDYNLTDPWIRAIHARGGVLGVILCDAYLRDGAPRARAHDREAGAEHSFALFCRHVDHIRAVTGSFDAVAIGSDFGGWGRPLEGFEHPGRLRDLALRLERRYGRAPAEQICAGNVLRALATIWPPNASRSGSVESWRRSSS
ncbi:MAG: membrane dipeptidase [Myxococcales bacterium]